MGVIAWMGWVVGTWDFINLAFADKSHSAKRSISIYDIIIPRFFFNDKFNYIRYKLPTHAAVAPSWWYIMTAPFFVNKSPMLFIFNCFQLVIILYWELPFRQGQNRFSIPKNFSLILSLFFNNYFLPHNFWKTNNIVHIINTI